MDYIFYIITMISIYSMLAFSLNLIAGYTGLISVCHAAFFGIGAYSTALLTTKFSMPWIPSIFVGIVFSTILAVVVGISSLRFRDDYLVIATLGFQEIFYNVTQNWSSLTNGPLGITGIPSPTFYLTAISSQQGYMIIGISICFITFLILDKLVRSPFGRVLLSIREDEVLTQSFGKNILKVKLLVFTLGAAFAAIAGSFFAVFQRYIDPSIFTVQESIYILAIVIIGGLGNIRGSLIGAIVMITIPEVLRLIGLPSSMAANLRQVIYGFCLIGFMLWRPNGLLGKHYLQVKGKRT